MYGAKKAKDFGILDKRKIIQIRLGTSGLGPVVVYESETWTLTCNEIMRLQATETKSLSSVRRFTHSIDSEIIVYINIRPFLLWKSQ